jgi:hypothetical protein
MKAHLVLAIVAASAVFAGAALGGLTVDGKPVSPSTTVCVESVSGDSLTATGGALKTVAGDSALGSVSLAPYSVTTLIVP